MKPWIALLACSALLITMPAGAESEWEPSKISEKTIKATQEAKLAYDRCLAEQLHAKIGKAADSRAIADDILRSCEDRLAPIRTALGEEKAPEDNIERYLRQLRSRAAQAVLRETMGAQAQRESVQGGNN